MNMLRENEPSDKGTRVFFKQLGKTDSHAVKASAWKSLKPSHVGPVPMKLNQRPADEVMSSAGRQSTPVFHGLGSISAEVARPK